MSSKCAMIMRKPHATVMQESQPVAYMLQDRIQPCPDRKGKFGNLF